MMVGLNALMSPTQFLTELSVNVLTFAKPIGIYPRTGKETDEDKHNRSMRKSPRASDLLRHTENKERGKNRDGGSVKEKNPEGERNYSRGE